MIIDDFSAVWAWNLKGLYVQHKQPLVTYDGLKRIYVSQIARLKHSVPNSYVISAPEPSFKNRIFQYHCAATSRSE